MKTLIEAVDFNKNEDGLVPAIIQDQVTRNVLMLGYMNREALQKSLDSGKVTFYSRSKARLWTKGEESGNFLHLKAIQLDCDQDTLLVLVQPEGPVCHKGSDTCWDQENVSSFGFFDRLEAIIASRQDNAEDPDSYVASLFRKGMNKIAQKVGEEAVETVIEALDDQDELFLNESADLLFHYLILLRAKGYKLADIEKVLRSRH